MRPWLISCFVLLVAESSWCTSVVAEDIFPHREQAMRTLADRLVQRLFLRPDIPDEAIRILHKYNPESVAAARLLAENLREKGYKPVIRLPDRPVNLECVLTVRIRNENHEAILHWTHSREGPLTVSYSNRYWLRPDFHRDGQVRITSARYQSSRESAVASVLKAARVRMIETIEIALKKTSFAVPPGENRIRTLLELRLPPGKVREHLKDTFLEQENGPVCTSYKAHVLLELSPEDVKTLAASVARDIRASNRRILGRATYLLVSLVLLAILYVWADGKTRGFLRGPLRLAFSSILLSLVLGALVT